MSQFADLSGLRAVVTGSSSGIGSAIALELARAGADVVIHCRSSRTAAEAVTAQIRDQGRRCELLVADLDEHFQLGDFVGRAWQALDGVDIWINNAGVDLLTGDGAQLDYQAKLQRLLDVDVRSTVLLSHEVGRRMQTQGQGSIINIGWDQAAIGMAGDSGELFATAKNAVMGFTRSLAVTLAPHVRVNCIAPGWIQTKWGHQASDEWQQRVLDETPLRRWGQPEDVAAVARFLAAPEAAYLTGQVINVNGGAVR